MSTHIARKRFGQNFLQDQKVIFDIIHSINPQIDSLVVEIGPGLGAITEPLLKQISHLHVIEIDRDLITQLKKRAFAQHLTIHAGDVLKFDFTTIAGKKKLVGNLPYNISTPLLFKLAHYTDEFIDMHFMLQKEVVERMVAVPDGPDFGRLSVILQYFFEMDYLFTVPAEAFTPAPKVESAIIRMIPNIGRIGIATEFTHFQKLVAQAFSQRRKTIRNTLKNIATATQLEAVGIDPNCRAENITPAIYLNLSNSLLK